MLLSGVIYPSLHPELPEQRGILKDDENQDEDEDEGENADAGQVATID